MEIDVGGLTPVTLPDDIYGIMGLRSWNVKDGKSCLQSLMVEHEWTQAVEKGEKPTTLPGQHGFYAYRLTGELNASDFRSTLTRSALFPTTRIQVHGLVELRGKVIEHAQGVVRGEWCRILCFFLPVPSNEPPDMKRQVAESGWLKTLLAKYRVPVYLTDTSKFQTILGRLSEFDIRRDNQPSPVEYKETRPEIQKKIDELIAQVRPRGYHIPQIILSRKQMQEFKAAIFRASEPLEQPVVYKRIQVLLTDYSDYRTPYLTTQEATAG
ncbi:MAG: hypothetical protein V1894_01390 [Chloroflexota bacterium]